MQRAAQALNVGNVIAQLVQSPRIERLAVEKAALQNLNELFMLFAPDNVTVAESLI